MGRPKAAAQAAHLPSAVGGPDTHVGRGQAWGLSQGRSQGSEGSRLKGREWDSLVVVVKLQDGNSQVSRAARGRAGTGCLRKQGGGPWPQWGVTTPTHGLAAPSLRHAPPTLPNQSGTFLGHPHQSPFLTLRDQSL